MPIDEDDLPPIPRDKLSKTPSWIMVGFVIGCLFAYVVDRELEKRRTPPVVVVPAKPVETPPPAAPTQTPRLTQNEVDAIFRQYADRANWENDLTEVVLWNSETGKFSEMIEVMRSGDYYYYRPLLRLTRPLISNEAESGGLILFTETETAREQRLKSIHPAFRPAPPKLKP